MTVTESKAFGDNLASRWPATDFLVIRRAFDLCIKYDFATVLKAMDSLRTAMKDDHLAVNADRLAAVCRQMAEGAPDASRTAARLAAEREQAAVAEQERAKTFAGGLAPEIDAQAEEACRKRYDATWAFFAPEAKEKLKKAWAKAGFPDEQ